MPVFQPCRQRVCISGIRTPTQTPRSFPNRASAAEDGNFLPQRIGFKLGASIAQPGVTPVSKAIQEAWQWRCDGPWRWDNWGRGHASDASITWSPRWIWICDMWLFSLDQGRLGTRSQWHVMRGYESVFFVDETRTWGLPIVCWF